MESMMPLQFLVSLRTESSKFISNAGTVVEGQLFGVEDIVGAESI